MTLPLSREEILAKASPEPNTGCWLWTGREKSHGYGRITIRGRTAAAHRVFYELIKGPIPRGMVLDHTCRVTCCVNPAHLEPVTQRENIKRGRAGAVNAARQRAKTHCPRGHEYAGDNLYIRGQNAARGCRTCRTELSRNWWRINSCST
jgi:hypothetical protein